MALQTTPTLGSQAGQSADSPVRFIQLDFTGDDAYPTGGTAAFEAYCQAALAEGITLVGVIDQSIGANEVRYDIANDKLMSFVKATGAQVADAADTSGVAHSVLLVCK